MTKKIFLMLSLIVALASCSGKTDNATISSEPVKDDYVEVIYFHGKKRCATCRAIETNTKDVINTIFANEIKNGDLVFNIVDISTPEGEAIADRYEVTWSSLFVNRWNAGNETRENITEFAFSNAKSSPDLFKKTLAEKIKQSLK